MRQLRQRRQRVEVREVPQRVVGQDEHREVWDEVLEVRGDARDPVVGEQERSQAREAREAVEGEDAVVGEVDRVELVLFFFFFFFFLKFRKRSRKRSREEGGGERRRGNRRSSKARRETLLLSSLF